MNVRLMFAALCLVAMAQDPKDALRQGLKDTNLSGNWIYDDLAAGFAEAAKTKKPMMVVLRCVPCGSFKEIDKQVGLREDPGLAQLMEKFVCVRVIQAWGLDLSLFQFDENLNWAVFLMNADRTLYGRYGTKCGGKDPVKHVSVEGLKKALEGALELHAAYPANKNDFVNKLAPPPPWKTPEIIPDLKGRPPVKPADGTRGGCLHCHMIHEGELWSLRSTKQPLTDSILWSFPLPDDIGISLSPQEKALVTAVAPNSSGEKSGIKAGDRIVKLEGQPILSIADIQWVLHNAKDAATLKGQIDRNGEKVDVVINLPSQWRRAGNYSWRTINWGMRHRLLGVEGLEAVSKDERATLGVEEPATALRVKGLSPNYAKDRNMAAAKLFQKGDVIVAVDGKKDFKTEGDVLAYLIQKKAPGQTADITLLRAGKQEQIQLPIP